LEGDHVFALPYASCLSTFQAPGWGISAVFPPRCWKNATPWELAPFSHRLASRIFISQPGCTPRRRSPKTVTTSPWVGRSKPGCDLGPTLSFKDVHHPRWGGGRAEPELYLPRGFVGQPLLRRSRERALTGPAGGSDFDNVGLVDGGRRQPQRVELVGLAPGAPPGGGCRAVCTGGPPKMSRAARAAFVFWGGLAFAPVWRLRAEVGAPLIREDLSGDLPEG
jgi:hypothetical protein